MYVMIQVISKYRYYNYPQIREIAHMVKENNPMGALLSAEIIESQLGDVKNAVLVPMPSRDGKAGYTKLIAEIISEHKGLEVVDCLKSKPHLSLYDCKYQFGIESVKPMDFFTNGEIISPDKSIILIDNVIDSGTTAVSAYNALGRDVYLAVLAHTNNHLKFNYPININ